MNIILLIRRNYYKYSDQINSLLNMGCNLHLITAEKLLQEPQYFKSINISKDAIDIIKIAELLKETFGCTAIITFLERDIVLAAEIAKKLDIKGLDTHTASICRDKSLQRAFLKDHQIPSPHYKVFEYDKIQDHHEIMVFDFPFIIKPTRASLSMGVYLVNTCEELEYYFSKLKSLIEDGTNHYYQDGEEKLILIEEYIPGREVTVDGVVINGRFVLGGIHNKMLPKGPTFEEDLYSLPLKTPNDEEKIMQVVRLLSSKLPSSNIMFCCELRQDNLGDYKVIEFSSRLSGAFCYRHIKAVYDIDLVQIHCKSLLGIEIPEKEKTRSKPKMTACTKWAFGRGIVRKNTAGRANNSTLFDEYYPIAAIGETVGTETKINSVGRVSVYGPYHSNKDIIMLEQAASELIKELDIQVDDEF